VAVLTVISFFVGGPGGPANVLLSLLSNLNSLLLFVALGWLGYRLWNERRRLGERLDV
jgi:hypothetical protein